MIEPIIFSSYSTKVRKIEPAGRAFHDFILKNENDEEDESEVENSEKEEIDFEKLKNKKRKRSWVQTG